MVRGISSFVEKDPTVSKWWMDSDDRPTFAKGISSRGRRAIKYHRVASYPDIGR